MQNMNNTQYFRVEKEPEIRVHDVLKIDVYKRQRFVETAKKKIAKTLRVSEKEIIFTSGGTESNNLAIIGAAMANRRAGNHIITTSIEHASRCV